MQDNTKNALVGLFTISGILIITVLSLVLRPAFGDGEKTIKIRFADVERVSIGCKVCFSGLPVGRITNIEYVSECRESTSLHNDMIFPFLITARIDSKIPIYATDSVMSYNLGLIGERVVGIKPNRIENPITLSEDQEMFASYSPGLEEVLGFIGELILPSASSDPQSSNIVKNLEISSRNIRKLSEAILELKLEEKIQFITDEVSNAYTEHMVKDKILNLMSTTESLISNMKIAISDIHNFFANGTAEEARSIITTLESISSTVDNLLNKLVTGNGSIGKLLQKDDIYNRLIASISSANELLYGIKTYGFFFHKNRDWKKQIGSTDQLQFDISTNKKDLFGS